MTVLFTFPGQGTQKSGMLKALMSQQETRIILERASSCLGQNVLELDTELALKNNKNVQLSITICSYACAHQLIQREISPSYAVGLSIGAFAAALVCGVISFETALNLVALRGKLMAEAYPKHYAMAAISGLELTKVTHLINIMKNQGKALFVANINTETQITVSGRVDWLQQLCKLAANEQASSAKLLRVNVPSHCALMKEQADEFYTTLIKAKLYQPKRTYVSANKARVLHCEKEIARDLTYNMANQVHWWETSAMIAQRGVNLVIEMKPGSVLTKLCKASMTNCRCLAMDNETLDNIEYLAKNTGHGSSYY